MLNPKFSILAAAALGKRAERQQGQRAEFLCKPIYGGIVLFFLDFQYLRTRILENRHCRPVVNSFPCKAVCISSLHRAACLQYYEYLRKPKIWKMAYFFSEISIFSYARIGNLHPTLRPRLPKAGFFSMPINSTLFAYRHAYSIRNAVCLLPS